MAETRQCYCEQPWPTMHRLGISGGVRFYICPKCEQIRREPTIGNTPGSVGTVSWHDLGDPALPEAVREIVCDLKGKRWWQERLL